MLQNQNTSCLCRKGKEDAEKDDHVIAIMQDWEKYKPEVERYQQVCKKI